MSSLRQPRRPLAATAAGASAAGPAGPGRSTAAARGRVPLAAAVLLLALCAAALAAGAAVWLVTGLGLDAAGAAFGATLAGVLVLALPLAMLALKLRHAAPASAAVAPAAPPQSGAASRSLFFQIAEREWARARRYNTGAALLLVDVDRHLRLCEQRGARAGEAVLDELLRSTSATLRGADVLTRLGDGQMAVFLAQADPTGAIDVAERIRERAERLELRWADQPLRITVSVGAAQLRPMHPNLQSLIEDARDALVLARQAGGNCVRMAPTDGPRARPADRWRDERRQPRRQPRP